MILATIESDCQISIEAARLRPSTCHDRADARDADVTIRLVVAPGVERAPLATGEVTMLTDHTGSLSTWGDLDHWASDGLRRYLGSLSPDDRAAVVDGIVAAMLDLEAAR